MSLSSGLRQNPAKLGYGVARNLVVSGYRGAMYFVNPHGGRLFDRPIYTDVASVPDPVDLAMILIPGAGGTPGAGGVRPARDPGRHHRFGRFP